MKDKYTVSTIISAYNSERFIRNRLENLVNQTLYKKNELEIIVIDSHSLQNEKEIVEEFKGKYEHITYIRTEERETVYKAWNRGIELAKGKYITNANTDDLFKLDALELMSNELELNKYIHAVYGDWLVTNVENDTFESDTPKFIFKYPDFLPILFLYYHITSHSALVRKSVFDKIGGYLEDFKVCGDRYFMLKFAMHGFKAKKIDEVVGLYLELETSAGHNTQAGKAERDKLIEYILYNQNFFRVLGLNEVPDNKTIAEYYSTFGSIAKGIYQYDGNNVNSPLDIPRSFYFEAVKYDRYNVEMLNNLGIIAFLAKEEIDKVDISLFRLALKKEPNNFLVRENLKLSQNKDNKFDDFLWMSPDKKLINDLIKNYSVDYYKNILFLLKLLIKKDSKILNYGIGDGSESLNLLQEGYKINFASSDNYKNSNIQWRLNRNKLYSKLYNLSKDEIELHDFVYCLNIDTNNLNVSQLFEKLLSVGNIACISYFEKELDQKIINYINENGSLWLNTVFDNNHRVIIFSRKSPKKYSDIVKPLISVLIPEINNKDDINNYIDSEYLNEELIEFVTYKSESQNSELNFKLNVVDNESKSLNILIENSESDLLLLTDNSLVSDKYLIPSHIKSQVENHKFKYAITSKSKLISNEKELNENKILNIISEINYGDDKSIYNNLNREINNNISILKELITENNQIIQINDLGDLNFYKKLETNDITVYFDKNIVSYYKFENDLSKFLENIESYSYEKTLLIKKYPELYDELFYPEINEKELFEKIYSLTSLDFIPEYITSSENEKTLLKIYLDYYIKYIDFKGKFKGLNEINGSNFSFDLSISEKPLISLILNQGKGSINNSIKGIISQNYDNWELFILIDNEDEIDKELIQDHSNKINVILKKNLIEFDLINSLIREKTKGKYLKIIESGDILTPFSLDSQVKTFEISDRDLKIVYGNFILKQNNNYIKLEFPFEKTNVKEILIDNEINLTSVLFDKETVCNLNILDQKLENIGYLDLIIRAIAKYDFEKIELPIFIYSGNEISNTDKNNFLIDKTFLKAISNLQVNEIIKDSTEDEIVANKLEKLAKDIFKENKELLNETPIKILEKAQTIKPESTRSNYIQELYNKNNKFINNLFEIRYSNPDILGNDSINFNNILENKIFDKYKNSFENSIPTKLSILNEEDKLYSFEYFDLSNLFLEYKTDMEKEGYFLLGSNWEFYSTPENWVNYINKNIDQLLVPTTFVKDSFVYSGVDKYKISVIPPVINFDVFNPNTEEYQLDSRKKFKFLFVGSIIERKGVDILLNAYMEEFSGNDDVSLIIYDNSNLLDFDRYEQFSDFINFLKNDEDSPEVIFINKKLSDYQLAGLYNSCDCFVYPFKTESSCENILQAMSCKLPVVTTNSESVSDFCNDENSYLINSEFVEWNGIEITNIDFVDNIYLNKPDAEHIKEIMQEVFVHFENAKQKSELAYENIINQLSHEKIFKLLRKEIDNLSKNSVLRKNIDGIIQKYRENAEKSLSKKIYNEAEYLYYKLCIYDDSESENFYNLGYSQMKLKKYQDAVESFSTSLELGMCTFELCNNLATCLEKTGDKETADLYYQKANELK